jgi:menaquinone-dependent protoporphyrinogen IX oxidase
MPKTAVIYRSTSGFTKRYAEWIAQELKADLFDSRKTNPDAIAKYDVIIFGGSLHAVGINGLKLIKNHMPLLNGKKVIVYAVGASPQRENVLQEVKEHNFNADMAGVALFYLQGGFNYSKLDFSNKVIMALFWVRLKLLRNRTSDEKGMMAAYSKPLDCTRKENIKPLIDYANKN